MTKELATHNSGSVPANLVDDLVGAAGSDFDKDDFLVPYITILQSNSPEVDEDRAEYVEGAKEAQFYNKGTQEVFDSIKVIVCKYERRYPVFKPKRGGFLRMESQDYYDDECEWNNDSSSFRTPDGNDIVESRCFYVLMETDAGWTPALIAMSSSQAKKAKSWATMITNLRMDVDGNLTQAPIFFGVWELTTKKEQNDKGSWWGYVIKNDGNILEQPDKEMLVSTAKNFRQGLEENKYKAQDEHLASGQTEESVSDEDIEL